MLYSTKAASHFRQFGRRSGKAVALGQPKTSASDEFRLFLLTFAGGFLFMSVYLA